MKNKCVKNTRDYILPINLFPQEVVLNILRLFYVYVDVVFSKCTVCFFYINKS